MIELPLPEEIRELREHHRLTRRELARLVYQTERSVAGWEQGARKIPMALWELLLWKLDGVVPDQAEFRNANQLYLFEEDDTLMQRQIDPEVTERVKEDFPNAD